MNIRRRAASLLLIPALLLLLFPALVTPSAGAETVARVDVQGFLPPSGGETPPQVTVSPSARYTLAKAEWYVATGTHRLMTEGEAFKAGETYYLRVELETQPGYTFTTYIEDMESITLSGSSEYVDMSFTKLASSGRMVLYSTDLVCREQEIITAVDITGFTPPAAGFHPRYGAQDPGSHYVKVQNWRVSGTDASMDAYASEFRQGEKYYVRYRLTAEYGYRFPEFADYCESIAVNGDPSLVNASRCRVESGGKVMVVYTADVPAAAPRIITDVALSGFVQPWAGEYPWYGLRMTVSPDAPYTVRNQSWFNVTDDADLGASYYEEGKLYSARVKLEPEYGCAFPEDLSALQVTLNGGTEFLNAGALRLEGKDLLVFSRDLPARAHPWSFDPEEGITVGAVPEGAAAVAAGYSTWGRLLQVRVFRGPEPAPVRFTEEANRVRVFLIDAVTGAPLCTPDDYWIW